MADKPSIAVVLINYNNEEDTIDCLDSLANQTLNDVLTIVVDNASETGSFESVTEQFDFPVFLQNDENRGFTGGNNPGIEYAIEAGAEWILLLNNDTVVEPTFLEEFLAASNELPEDAGVVNPLIHTYDTREVWSAGGMINSWTGRTVNRAGLDTEFDETERIDYAIGAALLARAKLFQDVGLLDDDFFIYYEETEFCQRASEAEWSIWYVPVTGVYHKETVAYTYSEFREYYFTRNRWLFQTKTQPIHRRAFFYPYFLVRCLLLQIVYLCVIQRNLVAAKATLRGGIDAVLNRTGKRHGG